MADVPLEGSAGMAGVVPEAPAVPPIDPIEPEPIVPADPGAEPLAPPVVDWAVIGPAMAARARALAAKIYRM
jgi:hypothetical protein